MNFFLKAICIIFIAISLTACQTDIEKKESFYKKGSTYYDNKEYKKAEIELKNALQIDPNYVEAYHLLAKNMLKLGNIKDALAVYNKIIQIDKDNIEANLKLAEFLLLSKNTEPAMEKIVFVLEKEPKNIEALHVKAQIFMQKEFFDKAFAVYETILDIDSNNIPAIQNMAKIHAIGKRPDEAEALLLKAITLDDKNLQVRMPLIGFYIQQGKLEKVEDQLQQAIKNSPENFEAHILLGNFYHNQKKNDLAEAAYLNSIKASPSALKPLMIAADYYDKVNNQDKALEMYTKAASLEPDNISVQETIARFHYSHKDIESANKIISAILSKRPQYYPARMLKSEILVFEKKFTEALQLLDVLEKEEPKAPRTYYFKGLCFIGTGNYDQAKTSVGKAVEINPGYFKARMLLSDIYLHEQSFDPAQKEASAALELNPNDYQSRIIRANAAIGLRKFEDAEKDYQKLIEIAPENPMAYYQLGLLKSALKEYDSSMGYLKAAYGKNNKLIDVFLQIVRNHVSKKEYETAHELCENQIKLYKDQEPLIAVVYNIQSGIYLAQKNIEKAKDTLSKAIETNPDYLPPYETLAKLFLAENNKEKAIEQYKIILEKNSKLPVPYMMIGTIYDSDKDYEKAADYYRKALEINPDFAPAANNLAYHFLQRTDNIDEALRLAKIAKAKFPEDPGIMDTLGMAYYRKELYGNAANEFLDSLKKIPNNPTVNYHLGLAYAKKGDKSLAVASLKKALELSDKFEEAKEAEQLISELEK